MFDFLVNKIIEIINIFGYPGVFILMAIESMCIPLPSEITMPFAGSLINIGRFNLIFLSLTGGFGNLAGSLIAYYIGYKGQENYVRYLIKKYGKFFLITISDFERSQRWFNKYGEIIVFSSRLLPAVRTFISLPAGIARMNIKKFILYTIFGSTIWSFFLSYIGLILGEKWRQVEGFFHKFDFLIFIIAIFLGGFFIFHQYQKIKKEEG